MGHFIFHTSLICPSQRTRDGLCNVGVCHVIAQALASIHTLHCGCLRAITACDKMMQYYATAQHLRIL